MTVIFKNNKTRAFSFNYFSKDRRHSKFRLVDTINDIDMIYLVDKLKMNNGQE